MSSHDQPRAEGVPPPPKGFRMCEIGHVLQSGDMVYPFARHEWIYIGHARGARVQAAGQNIVGHYCTPIQPTGEEPESERSFAQSGPVTLNLHANGVLRLMAEAHRNAAKHYRNHKDRSHSEALMALEHMHTDAALIIDAALKGKALEANP